MHPIIHILLQMLLTFTIRKLCYFKLKIGRIFLLLEPTKYFCNLSFLPPILVFLGLFVGKGDLSDGTRYTRMAIIAIKMYWKMG